MQLPATWTELLGQETATSYFNTLRRFVMAERSVGEVFPPADQVFTALELTPPGAVRVVILGQDPYHDVGQAHGLAFSVLPPVKAPASLRNVFKELHADLGCAPPRHGCLIPWAKQGVLLLNTVLTVRAHKPNSHRGQGWETFTDTLITRLSNRPYPIIFVLWGKPAQAKKKQIDVSRHIVLEAAHPSPLSAHNGFFGSRPFSAINRILCEWNQAEIDWAIPDALEVP
ncbi:MAG: uracil-DNA glycosylase [Planctomycetes bacterium]|nr:uracil-DNA glycosylase [Planctomycetota bacterium]